MRVHPAEAHPLPVDWDNPVSGSEDITRMLGELHAGKREVESRLVEAVYPELRRIAARYMRAERPGHTLQATALVNEAWLQLAAGTVRRDWRMARAWLLGELSRA